MPPERTPKKLHGQPTGPYLGKFVPSDEYIDPTRDDAKTIEQDPYRKYKLKTGKHYGHTLQRLNDEKEFGYLRWMINNPKACRNIDEEHVVKVGLLQWNAIAGDESTVLPSESDDSVLARNKSESLRAVVDVPARFKDSRGELIWITGCDIIGLFHMKKHHLDRFGVRPCAPDFSSPFRLRKFYLHQVYDAATRTPGRPIDETPDQALERYLAKIKKCGLRRWCDCRDCENIQAGPTEEGEKFVLRTFTEML